MKNILRTLQEISRYPSAIFGAAIILTLVLVAIYALVTIPYAEAVRLWRGGEEVWYMNPRTAAPTYVNWFTGRNLPPTIHLDSREMPEIKQVEALSEDTTETLMSFTFNYDYDDFPQEIILFFTSTFEVKQPHISAEWVAPDGRVVRLGQFSVGRSDSFRFDQDTRLRRRLGNLPPEKALLSVPDLPYYEPLHGSYTVNISAITFEENSVVEAELILFGQVHGLTGTDHRRRDLSVALLYGTPIALSFGLLAALGSTVSTMLIAATGVWFSKWVDGIIQRITEVNLILPVLPILIMIGTFYNRSIWLMLGVVILLSVFGAGIKTYRAIFLQVKESPYIEAAQAYGTGNGRIIIRYLVPRIIPLLIPGLVIGIPGYVFLEASLAILGLGDPVLPTWGKVIEDARSQGALFNGFYYWILQPFVLLMLTGLGFSMLGFALDRIFNPRLRGL
ncbi:MAG TPA: ABC transporter permease [Levilinea sp.]|nr:ABC transporter permease [Levilinea sp.]